MTHRPNLALNAQRKPHKQIHHANSFSKCFYFASFKGIQVISGITKIHLIGRTVYNCALSLILTEAGQ
jgi:hypothetical protein